MDRLSPDHAPWIFLPCMLWTGPFPPVIVAASLQDLNEDLQSRQVVVLKLGGAQRRGYTAQSGVQRGTPIMSGDGRKRERKAVISRRTCLDDVKRRQR